MIIFFSGNNKIGSNLSSKTSKLGTWSDQQNHSEDSTHNQDYIDLSNDTELEPPNKKKNFVNMSGKPKNKISIEKIQVLNYNDNTFGLRKVCINAYDIAYDEALVNKFF